MTWYQRNSTDHPHVDLLSAAIAEDVMIYYGKPLTQIRICRHVFEAIGMGARCLLCDFEPTLEQVICYLNTNSFSSAPSTDAKI